MRVSLPLNRKANVGLLLFSHLDSWTADTSDAESVPDLQLMFDTVAPGAGLDEGFRW